MLRRGLAATGAASAAGAAFAYYKAVTTMGEDAVSRMMSYNTVAVPAILSYKAVEARYEKAPKTLPALFSTISEDELTRKYEVLHHKWARPLFDKFMELGGFYYKTGQKVATNLGGMSPKVYVDMFQPFLDSIPPRDFASVRLVIEGELGRPMGDVFASFEEEPLGCASIGQVHRAVLRATGERVVVKVQNPEAERTFRGDVFALKVLVDAFAPQISVAFDEIAKQFATEFDYRGEMRNAQEVGANLRRAGFASVVVPRVHEQLCSRRLLVMEEVHPAVPLHQALERQAELVARQRGISVAQLQREEEERRESETRDALSKGRLVRQVTSRTFDRYIAAQRGRQRASRAWRACWNWTVGLLPGVGAYDLARADVLVPINAARLIDRLMEVHGHEVLLDGTFNADPHAGNVLYLEQRDQLALIDYGQVKRLSEQQRLDLAKTVVLVGAAMRLDPRTDPAADPAAFARAKRGLHAHLTAIGCRTEKMLADGFYEAFSVYLGRMDAVWLARSSLNPRPNEPLNLLQWSDKLEAYDPVQSIDAVDYLVMTNTVTLMIRGLGEILQQSRSVATAWGPPARRALQERGLLADVEAEIASWSAPAPPQ